MDIEKINYKARSEILNDSLRVRISAKTKQAFLNECENNQVDSATVIRALIEEYIEESKSLNKE